MMLLILGSFLLFFFVVDDSGTSDSTGSSGSDKTDLFTWRGISSDGRWFTDMLVVSSSVWMLDWIFGDTSDFWPAVPLHSEFMVGSASFKHRFVNSSATGDQTKHSSVSAGIQFFDTWRQFHSGFTGICVVCDNGAVSTWCFGDFTSVSAFFFQLANDGTFWHLSDWHDVTDGEGGFFTGVDELTGADTFWADHGFGDFSVFVWVLELDFSQWGAPAWIVNDVLYETLDETLSFGIIQRSEFGGAFSAFR
jgi:hypothetical protein